MVRNAGLNLRKGCAGRSDGHRRYRHHAIGHALKKNRPATVAPAGRPRDTMLIGRTYAKDAGGSCSDVPNYCEYAPRFRAEECGLFCSRKPKQLRSRFIQRPLNQICCGAVAKLLSRGKRRRLRLTQLPFLNHVALSPRELRPRESPRRPGKMADDFDLTGVLRAMAVANEHTCRRCTTATPQPAFAI